MTGRSRRRISVSADAWKSFRFGVFLVLAVAFLVAAVVYGYSETYGNMDSIMSDVLSDK